MRLGDGRSVTDDAERRLINQSARRRTSPCLVDFTTINDSDRRDHRGADRPQLNTLWDKRTGDKNRPFFNFLLAFGGLLDRGIGQHCSGKHAGGDESCSACRYQRLHERHYTREAAVQITETTEMGPLPRTQEGGGGFCHGLFARLD